MRAFSLSAPFFVERAPLFSYVKVWLVLSCWVFRRWLALRLPDCTSLLLVVGLEAEEPRETRLPSAEKSD